MRRPWHREMQGGLKGMRPFSRVAPIGCALAAAAIACAVPDEPDPCDLPGRPAMDGTTDRVLRGYVVAFAVGLDDAQVRWNHLAGGATVINYRDGYAYQYDAWASPVVADDVAHGEPIGDAGTLRLDGGDYAPSFSHLMFNFQADGSNGHSGGGQIYSSLTDLTLHPTSVDLRHGEGVPITTKVDMPVWNENEIKLSEQYRCVTCWDTTILSQYGVPNHMDIGSLQTSQGRARLEGITSAQCEGSVETALLGVAARYYRQDGVRGAAAGHNLVGMGSRNAEIRYTPVAPPPEAPGGFGGDEPDRGPVIGMRGDLIPAGPEAPGLRDASRRQPKRQPAPPREEREQGDDVPDLLPRESDLFGVRAPRPDRGDGRSRENEQKRRGNRQDPPGEEGGGADLGDGRLPELDAEGTPIEGEGETKMRRQPPQPPAPPPPPPPPAEPRIGANEKGSLLIFSRVEIRWDSEGNLIQDTFLSLTNDAEQGTKVKMFFINGDAPLEGDGCERNHPGWNFVNNKFTITKNQPIYWSVLTGDPMNFSPFTVLDPQ